MIRIPIHLWCNHFTCSSGWAHLEPGWQRERQWARTLSTTAEWQKLNRSFSPRAHQDWNQCSGNLPLSYTLEKNETDDHSLRAGSPTRTGPINAYLTFAETTINSTAPSQILTLSKLGGQQIKYRRTKICPCPQTEQQKDSSASANILGLQTRIQNS